MASDPRVADEPIAVGADGFFHPATEQELATLVKQASLKKVQLRVRGAAHSVAHAIYTDPLQAIPNKPNWQTPPPPPPVLPTMDVMLDCYADFSVRGNPSNKLVEAQAGIHLGKDPSDPTGKATDETSLLFRLWNKTNNPSWTLSDVGGITHQTVSGFTATGSSGGSLTYSANEDLYGFRVIDGAGNVQEFTRDDPDPSNFYAMAPNLGLQGVVSTVILQCVDAFNITGQESVTTVAGCAVDLFGPGGNGKLSLEQHLRTVPYTRIEWWPQPKADRVLVWQAQRIQAVSGFKPQPYREFGAQPDLEEVLLSILLTILGNLDDLDGAVPQITQIADEVARLLDELLEKVAKLGPLMAGLLALFITAVADGAVVAAIKALKPYGPQIKKDLPDFFYLLVEGAIPLDPGGEPQQFWDWAWHGLPMDNAVKDQLLPTGFTEIWVPLPQTQAVMQMLRTWFSPSDPDLAFSRTGLYAWEFYAAMPSKFWLSPSYTSGADEWKDGAFRVDPYWFEGNAGDPADVFYPQLWNLFLKNKIPFRLHWGKYQPNADFATWAAFFRSQYPHWDDFLTLRTTQDPTNTFLTSYWRDRFGLSDASDSGG